MISKKLIKKYGEKKYCTRCKVVRSLSRFYVYDYMVSSYCRRCRKKYARRMWAKDKDGFRKRCVEIHRRVKKECLRHYGSVCQCCKEHRFEFLTIDHKNGDGKEHRKKITGTGTGSNMYYWLKNNDYPQNLGLRVLCINCNCSFGFFGYCPHDVERQQVK